MSTDVKSRDDSGFGSSHCSTAIGVGSEHCVDSVPPKTRSPIVIAAELARAVDCQHRPIACEAARRLKDLADVESLLVELVGICEEVAVDMAHAGVSDDGRHRLSAAMMRLRQCRTERFEKFHPDLFDVRKAAK